MTRHCTWLLGSILVAGLLASPATAQENWGEPYSASQKPDPGDDTLSVTNRTAGPIWVSTNDPVDWDIVVSTTPQAGAAPIEPGMARNIGLTPGQYQVVSDGNEIGGPIQIVGGREYALELIHQPHMPALAFEARLIEEGEDVVVSWSGQNLTAPSAVLVEPTRTVIAYQCQWHPGVVSSTPASCYVCGAWLTKTMLEVR